MLCLKIEIMIEDIRLGGAMSKTIVEFKDVVKTYGSGDALLYAVNHIDFKIEEGEFVVILGQSGAGKSTVLNILGGMDQPTEEKSKSCDRQVQSFRGDSLVVEIDGLLYNGTINCMFDTDSFPGIV